eukprot:365009_1
MTMNVLNFIFPVLLCSSIAISASWDRNDNILPEPLFRMGGSYYPKTSTIFLFGGTAVNGTQWFNRNKIYKWKLNESPAHWIELAQNVPSGYLFSPARNSVSIGHMVYFIGISDIDNAGLIYTFNMETETFENNNIALPKWHPFFWGCLATNNSHLFLIGGDGVDRANGPAILGLLQILDLSRNIWLTQNILLPFIVPDDDFSGWERQQCVFVHDSLYVIGGQITNNWKNNNTQYIDGIYKYNTETFLWNYQGNIATSTGTGWAIYSSKYDQIYIVSGLSQSIIQIFDIKRQQIIDTVNMNGIVQNESAAFIVDDEIMVFGGCLYDWFDVDFPNYTVYSLIQTAKLPLIHQDKNRNMNGIVIMISIIVLIALGAFCCLCRKLATKKEEKALLHRGEGYNYNNSALINH